MFSGPLTESILQRAQKQGIIEVHLYDIRAHAPERHRTTDDYPFGGGPGMVMKPEPIVRAIEAIPDGQAPWRIFLTPQGRPFDQKKAAELAGRAGPPVLICGRYEGVDERVREGVGACEILDGE